MDAVLFLSCYAGGGGGKSPASCKPVPSSDNFQDGTRPILFLGKIVGGSHASISVMCPTSYPIKGSNHSLERGGDSVHLLQRRHLPK